jgi:hypothetical protein
VATCRSADLLAAAALVAAAGLTVASCSGDDRGTTPPDRPVTVATGPASTTPPTGPAVTKPEITTPAPPPATASVLPPARPPAPGRAAPDATAGPLRLTKVYVGSASGRYVLRADVTNTGATYLNDVVLDWNLLGAGDARLAAGSVPVASLAPGETTTVSGTGGPGSRTPWVRVVFGYR